MIYRCPICEEFVDDDWQAGTPGEEYNFPADLICPACVELLEEVKQRHADAP